MVFTYFITNYGEWTRHLDLKYRKNLVPAPVSAKISWHTV